MDKTAVLVMSYGTPADLGEVEAYYTHIRRGVPPPPELLAELVGRYRAIGGRSPLLEITRAQAAGLEERVEGVRCYVGQKHAPPFIEDAVEMLVNTGMTRAIGLVLAPHYSTMSVGEYARRATRAAQGSGWTGEFDMIDAWHLEPGFIEWTANAVTDALAKLPDAARTEAPVVFTAHSLPARIVEKGDPYADQLRATAEAVAARAGIKRWRTAWQSAGRTGDRWLGPDVSEVIEELAAQRTPGVVVCPCGFVADHLEVLYDLDIEARRSAERLGIAFERTASPNADPTFLDALADVVRRARTRPR